MVAARLQLATGQISNRLSTQEAFSSMLTPAINCGTLCVEVIDWLVSRRSTESFDRGHGAHDHRLRDHGIHKEVESR